MAKPNFAAKDATQLLLYGHVPRSGTDDVAFIKLTRAKGYKLSNDSREKIKKRLRQESVP